MSRFQLCVDAWDSVTDLLLSLITVFLVLMVFVLVFAVHLVVWLVCLPWDLWQLGWRVCRG